AKGACGWRWAGSGRGAAARRSAITSDSGRCAASSGGCAFRADQRAAAHPGPSTHARDDGGAGLRYTGAMFDNLQDKMDRVFKTLRGEASLNEWHIDNALKEIRVALLEADVHFKVVKEFTARVREKAVGQEVLTAFSPAQQVTKIVRDELQTLLGGNEVGLALVGSPAVIMMVGLQGSGKTTTSGKLALHLKSRGRRPLLVPCDVYRPAAIDQLRIVANNVKVPFFELGDDRDPLSIAERAVNDAKTLMYDTVILDTAGRLHIDDELMKELDAIKNATRPSEILFVADAMTGQDAVKSAKEFDDRLQVTGIVLTKLDGDA